MKMLPVFACTCLSLALSVAPAPAQQAWAPPAPIPPPPVAVNAYSAGPVGCPTTCQPACPAPRVGILVRIRDRIRGHAPCSTSCASCAPACPCPAPRVGVLERIRNRITGHKAGAAPCCP